MAKRTRAAGLSANKPGTLSPIDGTPWITDLLTFLDFEAARAAYGPIKPVTLPDCPCEGSGDAGHFGSRT
ncbi:hypothetical protein Q0Z83_026480 [Actinoplanes sichuanensis]|nr:hypothetical protein Q0Z83_026480 [Actinoplanes sichuanensis]